MVVHHDLVSLGLKKRTHSDDAANGEGRIGILMG